MDFIIVCLGVLWLIAPILITNRMDKMLKLMDRGAAETARQTKILYEIANSLRGPQPPAS